MFKSLFIILFGAAFLRDTTGSVQYSYSSGNSFNLGEIVQQLQRYQQLINQKGGEMGEAIATETRAAIAKGFNRGVHSYVEQYKEAKQATREKSAEFRQLFQTAKLYLQKKVCHLD